MDRVVSVKLKDIGAELKCGLCQGFPVECVTLTECCHIFCKSCIVLYIESNEEQEIYRVGCPVCFELLDESKPFNGLRSDHTLRTLLSKINPDMYFDEMKRRRRFFTQNPDMIDSTGLELSDEDIGRIGRQAWMPRPVPEKVKVLLQYDADLTFSLRDTMSPRLLKRQERAVAGGASFYVKSTASVGDVVSLLVVKYRLKPPEKPVILDTGSLLEEETSLTDVIRFRSKKLDGYTLKLSYIFLRVEPAQNHSSLAVLVNGLNNRRPPPIAPLFTGIQRFFHRKKKPLPPTDSPAPPTSEGSLGGQANSQNESPCPTGVDQVEPTWNRQTPENLAFNKDGEAAPCRTIFQLPNASGSA